MNKELRQALALVYDLALDNSLDVDHCDLELREHARRQSEALETVRRFLETGKE